MFCERLESAEDWRHTAGHRAGGRGWNMSVAERRFRKADFRDVKLSTGRHMAGAFYFLMAVDVFVFLVFLYFFAEGMGDNTVSSANLHLWLGILGGLGLVILGGVLMHRKGKPVVASFVLFLVAVPALLVAVWILWYIIYQPRWN
jgi:hypothetical protein